MFTSLIADNRFALNLSTSRHLKCFAVKLRHEETLEREFRYEKRAEILSMANRHTISLLTTARDERHPRSRRQARRSDRARGCGYPFSLC